MPPAHQTPTNELITELLAAYVALRDATTVGELTAALDALTAALTDVVAALALIPDCKTCDLFLFVSQVLANIRAIEDLIVDLLPADPIPLAADALVSLTLRLTLCLIEALTRLVLTIERCFCKEKKTNACKCRHEKSETKSETKTSTSTSSESETTHEKPKKKLAPRVSTKLNVHVNQHQDQDQTQSQDQVQGQEQDQGQLLEALLKEIRKTHKHVKPACPFKFDKKSSKTSKKNRKH